jgi:hypothetical protein
MKLKLLFITAMLCLFSTQVFSQNLARAYYIKAKEAYSSNQYAETLEFLNKAEKELGNTNPDILYLEMMSRFEIDKRDKKILELSEEFLKTASSNDDRTQKVGMIAVEHREILEADRKAEENAYKRAVNMKTLKDLRSYLRKYPNNEKIKEIQVILENKESQDFLNAKADNTVKDYEKYLDDYPRGKYKDEVIELLAEAREDELYAKAMRLNDIQIYKSYEIKYPSGKYKSEIEEARKKAILAKADKYFGDKEFGLAKNTYELYKTDYPDATELNLANERLKLIDKELKKEENRANQTSAKYILGTYSSNELFGLEFGRMSLRGVGTYFNINVNQNVGNISFSSATERQAVSNISENYEEAKIGANFGLTYKIIYPLWIYGGAGVVYTEYYNELEEDSVYYEIEGVDSFQFYPELGLQVKLGNVAVLKAGGAYIDSDIYAKVGIGFQTKIW